jgi:WD40 repeat protein
MSTRKTLEAVARHLHRQLGDRLACPATLAGPLLIATLAGLALGVTSRDPAAVARSATARRAAPPPASVVGLPLPAGALRRFGDDRFRVGGWPLATGLSPDGTRLAVLTSAQGRNEAVLTVFDADTGRPVSRGVVESFGFFATARIAFSPDGKHVAAVVTATARVVWAAGTGKLVTNLPPAKVGFGLCQFTPEGLLAVTDRERTDLYEIPSGKVAKTWPVGRIARLSADAKTFVRIEKEFDTISLGNPATGTVAGTIAVKTADNGVDNGVAFSPDGTRLAVVHDRKQIHLFDTASRKKLREVQVPESAIDKSDPHYAVSFSPDGCILMLETKRGRIERWAVPTLAPLPALSASADGYVRDARWSRDGRTILAVAGTGFVTRWDAKTGKRLPDHGYHGELRFAVTPSGTHLVAGDFTGRLDVFDAATGRLLRPLDWGPVKSRRPLVSLAVSPDGEYVAAGRGHIDVRVLRIDGTGPVRRISFPLRLDGGWMKCLAWAPDGKSLFADGSSMTIARVNLADGKVVWARPDENLPSFALSPDGRVVVKTLYRGIQFLDAATGKVASTVRPTMTAEQADRVPPVGAITFAPDGKHLALAVGAYHILICDALGREIRRFPASDRKHWPAGMVLMRGGRLPDEGHHRVRALAFSPDGKWIVSAADDLSVRVWEAATGKQVARFEGHDSAPSQVAVAPDGRSAFSAGGDGFVCQWDLEPKPSLPTKQQADLWAATAGLDPAIGVPASWALVTRSDESRKLVAAKLLPIDAAIGKQALKWLADLDAPEFADREAATKALAAQGRTVERQLRQTLEKTTSAEVRRRARGLLGLLEKGYAPDELRALRLVQACELSCTPAARALLHRWAGGAAGAVLTEDAKAALVRLDRRRR